MRDYPNWEVLCTIDGFKFHHNGNEALKKFADNKIRMVKKERGTSHINQSYNQFRAVKEKSVPRQMIGWACRKVHGNKSQWHLIGILCVGIKYCKEESWVSLFKTVNLHPHHWVSLEEWVERISAHIRTVEKNYYRTHEDLYYDACPSVWKRMDVEDRQAASQLLVSFIVAFSSGKLWTKEIVAGIYRYCPLCDIPKLCVCHIFAKNRLEVIVRTQKIIAIEHDSDGGEDAGTGGADDDDNKFEVVGHGGGTGASNIDTRLVEIDLEEEEEVVDDDAVGNAKKELLQSGLQYFCLMPVNLMVQDLRMNRKAQEKLFRHMCNVGVREKWEGEACRVSDVLDVAVTADNNRIFNPSPLDTIIGYIMQDAKVEGAHKKLPHRRFNIIYGCINSYCVHLNSPARIDLIRQEHNLAAVLADMDNDRQMVRDASKKRAVNKDTARIQKARVNKDKAEDKQRDALTQCVELMQEVTEKGVNRVDVFSLGHLKNIVCYRFGRKAYRDKKNKKDHKKARLLVEVKRLVEAQREIEAHNKALGGAVRVDDGEATGGSARGDGDGKEITFAGVLV